MSKLVSNHAADKAMLDACGYSNYLHASDPDPLSIAATQRLTAGSLGQQVARIGTLSFLLTPV